ANPEIHISGTALAAALACLAVLIIPIFLLIRKKRRTRGTSGRGEPDWSVPAIAAYADRISFFHQWDTRIKVVSLFFFCFMVVALRTLCWSTFAFGLSLLAVIVCRIPFKRALQRLLAMAGFLSMFLVAVPFTAPLRSGETLIYLCGIPGYPFHTGGFFMALIIVVKACAIALMMEPLLGTAPLADTLQGLSRLGLPPAMGQMILLCHRYIFVFLHEITRMYRGMRVRGFVPGSNIATMHAMGNFFGMLFVRSFDRTQRVHEAMLCRGYNGNFPSYVRFESTGRDWVKGALWGIAGLFLLFADRVFGPPF
ncbi:MAG: hypothetical protein ACD_75C00544G0003, partial [uncultured bacterium]